LVNHTLETPMDAELIARQRDTKWTYMKAVAELLRHDKPETRKLAGEIAQFVKDVPVAQTRTTALVKELAASRVPARSQVQARELPRAGPGGASQDEPER